MQRWEARGGPGATGEAAEVCIPDLGGTWRRAPPEQLPSSTSLTGAEAAPVLPLCCPDRLQATSQGKFITF